MFGPKFLVLAAVAYGQQCVIDVGGSKFDFTSLASKQLTFVEGTYTYEFTFCQPSPTPCGALPSTQSSLCQSNSPYVYSLGLWEYFKDWRVSSAKLTGTLMGEYCHYKYRVTNVTFQCGEGPPAILSMDEIGVCDYQMVVQVPGDVCSTVNCCAPPTYTSVRMEIGGSKAVVQRDASTGDWFDGNYQGRGQRLLCSSYYNRCFTYPPTLASCVGSAYRTAPVQCYGINSDWSFVAQEPLSEANPILQTVWLSALDGNYVVTMPLGSSSSCVPVSGSAIDTSVGFSLTPDSSLWEVPQICLKQLNISKF